MDELSTIQTNVDNTVIDPEYLATLNLAQLTLTSTLTELGLSTNVNISETQALDIISIDELLNSQAVILQKESADIDRLNSFFAPTMDSLRASLLDWATKGFPPVEKIATLTLDPPDMCSDGQVRTLPYYIEYILKDSITNKLNALNAKTQGMSFTFSWVNKSISLYVTRL
jgi:hypothetical protein